MTTENQNAVYGHNTYEELPSWDINDLYSGKDCPKLRFDIEKIIDGTKNLLQAIKVWSRI